MNKIIKERCTSENHDIRVRLEQCRGIDTLFVTYNGNQWTACKMTKEVATMTISILNEFIRNI